MGFYVTSYVMFNPPSQLLSNLYLSSNSTFLAKVLRKGSWTCVYSKCLSLHFLLPHGQSTSHAKDKVQI